MKKKILTVVGARPQFVKAAVLSRAFQKSTLFEDILVHTGQHFDDNMSAIFFEELAIPAPKYSLHIQGGSHGQMTGRMLEAIEGVLLEEKADAVLVYGDTNSTLAGALAAAKLHIPVIHVEAGLRSYNTKMPEEINRVLTDHMSAVLLCPTQTAIENLRTEGITKNVYLTGDVMYDATLFALEAFKKMPDIQQKMNFLPQDFIFMTVHREESTESVETFKKILIFAEQLLKKSFSTSDTKIIFPVHPRTRKMFSQLQFSECFVLLDPLSYFETQYCLSKAQAVLTDSGGLQKEAYFHRVPCVTVRSETEWVETITQGWNRLWTVDHYAPRRIISDYGTGQNAETILTLLEQYFFKN